MSAIGICGFWTSLVDVLFHSSFDHQSPLAGRMDRALQLAAPLAEAVDAAPAQFLAEQCSQRAADARL